MTCVAAVYTIARRTVNRPGSEENPYVATVPRVFLRATLVSHVIRAGGMRRGGAALLFLLATFVGVARTFDYVDAPIQLLDVSGDHSRFELVDHGLDFLRSIKAPFAIVAVGGAAKSGKSSLLNQILNVSNSAGFDGASPCRDHCRLTWRVVSAGFRPGTLGIFFWGRPFQAQVDGANVTVIFMDSEARTDGRSLSADIYRVWALTRILPPMTRSCVS